MAEAVFIGRFQPFHKGHLNYIKKILAVSVHLTIFIGSADKYGTECNPYSLSFRKRMIRAVLKSEGFARRVRLLSVKDYASDREWVRAILKRTGEDIVVHAGDNRITAEIFRAAGIRVFTGLRYRGISSTGIRKRMRDGKGWEQLVPESVRSVISS